LKTLRKLKKKKIDKKPQYFCFVFFKKKQLFTSFSK